MINLYNVKNNPHNPHKPYSIPWYAFRYNIALAAVGEALV